MKMTLYNLHANRTKCYLCKTTFIATTFVYDQSSKLWEVY